MARYKGQRSAKEIDRGYPHQVCLDVPGTGLGALLQDMLSFCVDRDHAHRSGDDRSIHQSIWCFTNQVDADAFHARFAPRSNARRIDR